MSMIDIFLYAGIVLVLVAIAVLLVTGRKSGGALEDPGPAKTLPEPTAAPSPARAPEMPPPVPQPTSPFLAVPDGAADDLLQIKGIGPKLSARLTELGVFHFRQIADWSPEQLAEVDAALGNFQGRPARDQWQNQARLLAAGDTKAYERMHGKLGQGS